MPTLRILLAAKVLFLLMFFALAVALGPFSNSDTAAALVTAFAGIAAMATQNAAQRLHLGHLPPTTIMTGNTTQATLDAIDLLTGVSGERGVSIRARFRRLFGSIASFASGCAVAAFLYAEIGFWCLAVPVAVSIAIAMMPAEY